jgi:DNA replication protein DnaC
LLPLEFIKEITNIILFGPNGVGKSTIAKNIAYQTVMRGFTALFITAGQMLNDLASQDGDNALRRRIKYYVRPTVLIIDEVGYLSYSNRHADLLFEIISRRYQEKPTIVTTNKQFSEWNQVFPNAACDDAAYHLVTFLTELTAELEARYFAQMRRYVRDNCPLELPDILQESDI